MSNIDIHGPHPFLKENLHTHVSEQSINVQKSRATKVMDAVTGVVRAPKFFERLDLPIHNTLNRAFGSPEWGPVEEKTFTENARILRIGFVAMIVFGIGMFTGLFAGIPAIAAFLAILTYGICTSDYPHAPEAAQILKLVMLMDPLLIGLKELAETDLPPRERTARLRRLFEEHLNPFTDYVNNAILEIKADESVSPAVRASRVLSFLITIEKILDHYNVRKLRIEGGDLFTKTRSDSGVRTIEQIIHRVLKLTSLPNAESLIEEWMQEQAKTFQRTYQELMDPLISGDCHDLNTAEQTFYALMAAKSLVEKDAIFEVSETTKTSPAFERINPLLNVEEKLISLIAAHSNKRPDEIQITPGFAQSFANARSPAEACKVLRLLYRADVPANHFLLLAILQDKHLALYKMSRDLREATHLIEEYRETKASVTPMLDTRCEEAPFLEDVYAEMEIEPEQANRIATLMARDITHLITLDPRAIEQEAIAKSQSTVAIQAGFREQGITARTILIYIYQILRYKYDRPANYAREGLKTLAVKEARIRRTYKIEEDVNEETLALAREEEARIAPMLKEFEDAYDKDVEHHATISAQLRKQTEAYKHGRAYELTQEERAAKAKSEQLQRLGAPRFKLSQMEEIDKIQKAMDELEEFLENIDRLGTIHHEEI